MGQLEQNGAYGHQLQGYYYDNQDDGGHAANEGNGMW